MSQANRLRARAAAFAICVLVACSSPEERFAERVESALQLAEAGEIEDAILEYRSALKINPDDSNVNEQLGNLLLRRGDLDAVYYFSEAIRLDPSRIDIAMRLAEVLLVSGRTDQAEKVIDTARAAHPEAAVVYITQAELFLYQNDPEQALAAAMKATELDPDDPNAWLKLGRVHEGRIRMAEIRNERPKKTIYREALAAFERADEIAGGLVAARIERARILGARVNTRDQARAAFAEAIELAEEQGDEFQHFAAAGAAQEFAVQMDKKRMRIWALREMLQADDSRLDLWQELAKEIDATSPFGVVIYNQLLQKRPDDVGAHLMFASYLVSRDHVGDAVKHLRDVIKRDLGSPLPWEQLIRLQILQGRIANARAAFVRMSDEFPDDPVTRRTEARIALAEGRVGDAAEIMRAVAATSEDFQTQHLLAVAEYRNQDLPNAAAAIDRALALRADFALESVRLKARIHHDSEEWAALLRALRQIARNGHSLRDAEKLMSARAFYGLDRPEKGAEMLEQILAEETPPRAVAVEYARREGDVHPEQAAAHLEAALSRAPGNPELLEELVEINLRAGNAKAALFRLNAAIDSGRARPRTLLLRARAFTAAGSLDRAEADALRAFEADPALPGGVDTLYAIYEAQGRLDEARTSFEEAEAAGVLHSGARLLLGRIYLRQGETDRAQEMFEKVLHDDANMTGAKIDLAYLLAESDRDLDRALQLAEEAQRSMSEDPDAAHTVGYVYFRKGLHEAALQQLLRAVEFSEAQPGGREPTLRYHLGLTLDALHRNEEAVDAFEKALAIDSDFPHAADARRRLEAARRPRAAATSPS
jgi:tetratricopeptide (TPR) repeat protein